MSQVECFQLGHFMQSSYNIPCRHLLERVRREQKPSVEQTFLKNCREDSALEALLSGHAFARSEGNWQFS